MSHDPIHIPPLTLSSLFSRWTYFTITFVPSNHVTLSTLGRSSASSPYSVILFVVFSQSKDTRRSMGNVCRLDASTSSSVTVTGIIPPHTTTTTTTTPRSAAHAAVSLAVVSTSSALVVRHNSADGTRSPTLLLATRTAGDLAASSSSTMRQRQDSSDVPPSLYRHDVVSSSSDVNNDSRAHPETRIGEGGATAMARSRTEGVSMAGSHGELLGAHPNSSGASRRSSDAPDGLAVDQDDNHNDNYSSVETNHDAASTLFQPRRQQQQKRQHSLVAVKVPELSSLSRRSLSVAASPCLSVTRDDGSVEKKEDDPFTRSSGSSAAGSQAQDPSLLLFASSSPLSSIGGATLRIVDTNEYVKQRDDILRRLGME